MTSATPGRAAVLLFAAVLVHGACQPRAETAADASPDPPTSGGASTPAIPVAMDPMAGSYGVDTRRLSLDQPGEQVVVTSKGEKFITVSEYNAWLGTYPLAITSEDQAIARKQAVDQMVSFKLLAERARQSGYGKEPGRPENEKSMVLMYIRDQLSNTGTITNDQGREYLASHREYLAQLESADIPEELKLSVMKSGVLGERLTERLKGWQDEADLGYAPDVGPPPVVEGSR